MQPLLCLAEAIRRLKRLQFSGMMHIPRQGPALIAAQHSSPLDLFYLLSLMQAVGRQDHRFIMAAEMVDEQMFRPYVQSAIRVSAPHLAWLGGLLARAGSRIVPPLLRPLHPIPVYRKGDDSAARQESLQWLLDGHVLTIAPGSGNHTHRDSNGMRPLRYGVASLARRFFDATQEPLVVIPLGICGRGMRSPTYVRIGKPLNGMSDRHYPALFSRAGQEDEAIKRQVYQDFTRQVADRIAELCWCLSPVGCFSTSPPGDGHFEIGDHGLGSDYDEIPRQDKHGLPCHMTLDSTHTTGTGGS